MGVLGAKMSVKTREQWPSLARTREKRRGKRMNSRVPVRVEWDAANGKRMSVEAHTRIVNSYGCLVVLSQDLALEHRVLLNNLVTNTSNIAIVVWKGNPRPEGWEYGIELVGPDMDFWGLEL